MDVAQEERDCNGRRLKLGQSAPKAMRLCYGKLVLARIRRQTVKHNAIPAGTVLEAARHARNGGGGYARGILDANIGNASVKHASNLKPLSQIFYLTGGHQIRQQARSLIGALERDKRIQEIPIRIL